MTPAWEALGSQPSLADAACTVCLVTGVPCCPATNLPLAANPSRPPAEAGQKSRQGEAAAYSRLAGCSEQVSAVSTAGSSSQEAALALALGAASVSTGDNVGQATCCTSGAPPEKAAAVSQGNNRHCAAALRAQVQDLRIQLRQLQRLHLGEQPPLLQPPLLHLLAAPPLHLPAAAPQPFLPPHARTATQDRQSATAPPAHAQPSGAASSLRGSAVDPYSEARASHAANAAECCSGSDAANHGIPELLHRPHSKLAVGVLGSEPNLACLPLHAGGGALVVAERAAPGGEPDLAGLEARCRSTALSMSARGARTGGEPELACSEACGSSNAAVGVEYTNAARGAWACQKAQRMGTPNSSTAAIRRSSAVQAGCGEARPHGGGELSGQTSAAQQASAASPVLHRASPPLPPTEGANKDMQPESSERRQHSSRAPVHQASAAPLSGQHASQPLPLAEAACADMLPQEDRERHMQGSRATMQQALTDSLPSTAANVPLLTTRAACAPTDLHGLFERRGCGSQAASQQAPASDCLLFPCAARTSLPPVRALVPRGVGWSDTEPDCDSGGEDARLEAKYGICPYPNPNPTKVSRTGGHLKNAQSGDLTTAAAGLHAGGAQRRPRERTSSSDSAGWVRPCSHVSAEKGGSARRRADQRAAVLVRERLHTERLHASASSLSSDCEIVLAGRAGQTHTTTRERSNASEEPRVAERHAKSKRGGKRCRRRARDCFARGAGAQDGCSPSGSSDPDPGRPPLALTLEGEPNLRDELALLRAALGRGTAALASTLGSTDPGKGALGAPVDSADAACAEQVLPELSRESRRYLARHGLLGDGASSTAAGGGAC